MTAAVVIPARLASTRFAEKVLASDTGRPLVQHVVDRARQCRRVREVIVAADDPRIVEALRPYETRVVLTDPKHPSGTDRITEVAESLPDQIIVNVQADEPEIEPETIDRLIDLMHTSEGSMATVATPLRPPLDPADPNLVKVVCGPEDRAIYFSRSPIPFDRDGASRPTYYLHVGIYAYARPFLIRFAGWKPTPLEQIEKLEQLRAIEHSEPIFVLKVDRATHGIDTREQYDDFVRRWRAGNP